MKERIKALWLCSWYPDKVQPQNGDFIQRQAVATSLYSDVTTIHVTPCTPNLIQGKKTELVSNSATDLNENILYYKKKNFSTIGKIASVINYFWYYQKWIKKYFSENGEPDIIHLNIAMRDGIMALWIKWKYKIPYVLTEHWTLYQDPNGYLKSNPIDKWFIKKIFKNADKILPVSTQLGDRLKILFNTECVVVPNVVNTDIFLSKSQKNDTFNFLHISDASPKKNVLGIINAFKLFHSKFPKSKLIILGCNPELPILDTAKNYPAIELMQTVSYEDVATIIQEVQVTIVNSFFETFSCVIIESLACEVPVISTKVGIAPDIINQKNGILIDFNEQSLLDAMVKCYQNYSFYKTHQDSTTIQKQFSYKKIGAAILDVYSEILNKS